MFDNDTAYIASDFSGDALSDAITRFANDFQLRKNDVSAKVERSYMRVLNHFGSDNIKKLASLYDSF